MKKHSIISLFFLLPFFNLLHAQELQARVSVNAQQVGTTVDPKTFTTLQTALANLINNRKWTDDVFEMQERIQCNFLLIIQSVTDDNTYKATLTIQAARPVYNSSYQATLINFQDADLVFKYIQFQPLDFDENRVQGSDALTANLTATIAYYVYIILGFDYDSFSPKGGEDFFQQAQNIVTNAPEAKDIGGWKSFDGLRNRYWLAQNIMDNRYNIFHDVIYQYYRSGLDSMYDNANTARQNILNALSKLEDFNRENPNTMILQFFIQNKSDELAGIFQKASPTIKSRALELLTQLDVANISKYQSALR
ncbi:MAG: DUF4835 family protein [Chitinophagaceae bacterium]